MNPSLEKSEFQFELELDEAIDVELGRCAARLEHARRAGEPEPGESMLDGIYREAATGRSIWR